MRTKWPAKTLVIVEVRPDCAEAMELIAELDTHLNRHLYPPESRHAYSVERLVREGVAFFVARHRDAPAGCCGLKLFGREYGEVKRMFVRPGERGRGLGRAMLDHVADYALSRRVGVLRLETGIHQKEAIRLYERYGFRRRPPFGEYRLDPLSLYFEKALV